MRALCGAIITAGALIGLGLSIVGFGLRAGQYAVNGAPGPLNLSQADTPVEFAVIFLTFVACVGLAIAFLGLAYHHHHRHHELLHLQGLPVTGRQALP